MNTQGSTLVMIPEQELDLIKSTQQEILLLLKNFNKGDQHLSVKNITAKEFMDAIHIRRTKFDELVKTSKIKIIKKKRKIYVPVTEIDRYFNDPSIK